MSTSDFSSWFSPVPQSAYVSALPAFDVAKYHSKSVPAVPETLKDMIRVAKSHYGQYKPVYCDENVRFGFWKAYKSYRYFESWNPDKKSHVDMAEQACFAWSYGRSIDQKMHGIDRHQLKSQIVGMFRAFRQDKLCEEALSEFKNKLGALQAHSRYVAAHPTCVAQSDVATAFEQRYEREHIQRKKAAEAARAKKKQEDKDVRAAKIKAKRDKRNPIRATMEPQVGFLLPLALIGGGIIAGKVKDAFKHVTKAASKIADQVAVASEGVSGLASILSGAVTNVIKALEAAKNAINSPFFLVPIAAAMWFMVMRMFRHSHYAQLLLVTALGSFVGPALWAQISNFFIDGSLRPPTVEAQAGPIDALPGLLTTVFTFGVFKQGLSHKTIGEAMRRVALIGRAKEGFECVVDWSLQAVECLINFFGEKFGKGKVCLRHPSHPALTAWARAIDELDLRMLRSPSVEYCHMLKMDGLIAQGNNLKKEYSKDLRILGYIQAQLNRMTSKFAHHVGAFNAADNYRVEPIFVMINGSPGIGKTLLLKFMATAILMMSKVLPADVSQDELKANIWQKGSSKYHEGYVRQSCVMLDDFGQERFVASGDGNPAMDVIRSVSSWAYPLDMANAELKGKFSFNTPLIMGTTNHDSLRVIGEAGCYFPEAMIRRLSHPLCIEVKPQYRMHGTTRLDFRKYREELEKCKSNEGLARQPLYIWDVYRHDFMSGARLSGAMGLEDVIREIATDLEQRTRQHMRDTAELDDYIESVRATLGEKLASTMQPQAGEPYEQSYFSQYVEEEMQFVDEAARTIVYGRDSEESWAAANTIIRYGLKNLLDDEEKIFGIEKKLWQTFVLGAGFAIFALKPLTMLVGAACGALFGMVKEVLRFFHILPAKKKRYSAPVRVKKNSNASAQSNVNVRGIGAAMAAPKHETYVVRDPNMSPQAGNVKVVNNIVANGWRLFTHHGDTQQTYGQITYLTSNLAIMPHHFYIDMKVQHVKEFVPASDIKVILVNNLNPSNVFTITLAEFMEQEVHIIPERDLCFVKMRSTYAPRTVIQNFLKEDDLKHISGKRVRLDVNEFQSPDHASFPLMRSDHADCYWYKDPVVYNDIEMPKAIAYDFPVMSGDCGSVLSLQDGNHFSGRFGLGIHVCTPLDLDRRGRVGVSTILTQEIIIEACKALSIVLDRFKDTMSAQGLACTDEYELFTPEVGSFTPICKIDRAYPLPARTKLYQTSYYGSLGPHVLKPAIMSPIFRNGELVYPMLNAIRPYSSPLLSLNKGGLRQALHVAMRPFCEWSKNSPRGIFSFEEAVLGIPSLKFRSIPRGTSAGFPHVFHVRKGKVEFFGEKQDYDLTTPAAQALRVRVAEINEAAKRGERMGHVFLDFLKDELRKPEKVEAVATRLISSAPLELTVSTRQYCGAFCAAIMESPAICGLAPGINVYTQWNGLSNFLQRKGAKVFAGDVKGLDASEQVDMLHLIVDFMNDWYADGEENARVRQVLLMELYHSRHLGGDGRDQCHIYQWNKGMPSGHPLTTIVNSIYTLAGLVACYIESTGDAVGFWDHVNAVTYGDDNVCNVDDATIVQFNQVTVAAHMKKLLGIVFTSDRKDGTLISHTDLSGVTFLKRSFYRDSDRLYNAPLELDSFLYTFYWCRNKKDEDNIISDVLETALCELSLHPSEVWDEHAPKILNIVHRRCGLMSTRCHPSREAYRDVVRTRGDSWY